MRLVVTGGRHYRNRTFVFRTLHLIHAQRGIEVLIHGACPFGNIDKPVGADWLADAWARFKEVEILPFPVDHAVDGPWPRCGPRRNGRMLRDGRPDGVVRFPGDAGTKNCVQQARQLGIPVWSPREVNECAETISL